MFKIMLQIVNTANLYHFILENNLFHVQDLTVENIMLPEG